MARPFEEAPMLRAGVANDEEAALPDMSKNGSSAGKNRSSRNTVLFVMWRIIWLLAATSVVVLLIYAPWPGQAESSRQQGMGTDVETMHDGMHGDTHEAMHGSMHGSQTCCNSTQEEGGDMEDDDEDCAPLPTG